MVPGTKRTLTAVLCSLLLAALTLVIFVLPAEYNLDPSGVGEFLGIKGMSGYAVNAVAVEDLPYRSDQVEFPLAPFESVEYKYTLRQGQAIVFSWHSDGEVVYDFHSEQAGQDPEDAVSFLLGRGAIQHGTYVAPFDGIHGWFWENRGAQEVIVKLQASGYFSTATTFTASGEFQKAF